MSHNFLTYDLKLDLYYKIVHAGGLTHWICANKQEEKCMHYITVIYILQFKDT